jgi:hypothetical protein
MDRAEVLSALEHCEQTLSENDRNISAQNRWIAAQQVAGQNTTRSTALLETFKQLRQSHFRRRARLLRDLFALAGE